MDMGVHCIDLIQYITNSRAKKIGALAGTKTFKYEVEDSVSLLMEMDNGSFSYVEANYNIPDAAAKCRLEIYGTRGSMLAEGTINQVEGGKLDVVLSEDKLGYNAQQNRNDAVSIDIQVEFGNMYTKQIESFSNSIQFGNPIEASIENASQVQKIVEISYVSSINNSFIIL